MGSSRRLGPSPGPVNDFLRAIPERNPLSSLEKELVDLPEWPAGPRREENRRERYARKDAKNSPGPGEPLLLGHFADIR